jgi:hypothetical protein
MFQLINDIIQEFRWCFKRVETWKWFVVLLVGFMVRTSHRGVTAIISSLRLEPGVYHTLLNYFRSNGYSLLELYSKWIEVVSRYSNNVYISERKLMVGDHLKMPKEGRRMPGIQRLHQESQNAGKPEYTEGHIYAQVSAVITNGDVYRSLPLRTQRQESPPKIEGTKKPDGDTLVVQMVNLAIETTKALPTPKAVIALDAYFAKGSAFLTAAQAVSDDGERLLEIITRAPKDTVAFTIPIPPTQKKRGQPRKYGEKVKLYSLFSDVSRFTETTLTLYGKKRIVRFLCSDLVWTPTKGLIRFVCVDMGGSRCVLMASDLTLSPEDIITAYALRFKIEDSFDEQKNDMGSFSYRFWTKSLPKRKKWHNNQNTLLDTT